MVKVVLLLLKGTKSPFTVFTKTIQSLTSNNYYSCHEQIFMKKTTKKKNNAKILF